jgi:hypothetical protein
VPIGGALVMRNDFLGEGREIVPFFPALEPRIGGNRFINDAPRRTIFVRNLTVTAAILIGDAFEALSAAESVRSAPTLRPRRLRWSTSSKPFCSLC